MAINESRQAPCQESLSTARATRRCHFAWRRIDSALPRFRQLIPKPEQLPFLQQLPPEVARSPILIRYMRIYLQYTDLIKYVTIKGCQKGTYLSNSTPILTFHLKRRRDEIVGP